ncbi:MAG TPA: class II aldolase/adducin family protein [Kofleriaceae bacterium]|nr:class II aldolase/adducin family protein [Kofleriaceae bacterium]
MSASGTASCAPGQGACGMCVTAEEGVIKFEADHRGHKLDPTRYGALADQLAGWRQVMSLCGLVGQDPGRYGGAGFGNLSVRVGPPASGLGRRAMLISGTQTGGLPRVAIDDFCVVERYDVSKNRVTSAGMVRPSSESMTHGAIYDLGPHIRAVLHAHAPTIWRRAAALAIPTTRPEVPYGTQDMAREMERLRRETALSERQILSMAGHEDGIIAFGRSLEEAGRVLMTYLARSLAP